MALIRYLTLWTMALSLSFGSFARADLDECAFRFLNKKEQKELVALAVKEAATDAPNWAQKAMFKVWSPILKRKLLKVCRRTDPCTEPQIVQAIQEGLEEFAGTVTKIDRKRKIITGNGIVISSVVLASLGLSELKQLTPEVMKPLMDVLIPALSFIGIQRLIQPYIDRIAPKVEKLSAQNVSGEKLPVLPEVTEKLREINLKYKNFGGDLGGGRASLGNVVYQAGEAALSAANIVVKDWSAVAEIDRQKAAYLFAHAVINIKKFHLEVNFVDEDVLLAVRARFVLPVRAFSGDQAQAELVDYAQRVFKSVMELDSSFMTSGNNSKETRDLIAAWFEVKPEQVVELP